MLACCAPFHERSTRAPRFQVTRVAGAKPWPRRWLLAAPALHNGTEVTCSTAVAHAFVSHSPRCTGNFSSETTSRECTITVCLSMPNGWINWSTDLTLNCSFVLLQRERGLMLITHYGSPNCIPFADGRAEARRRGQENRERADCRREAEPLRRHSEGNSSVREATGHRATEGSLMSKPRETVWAVRAVFESLTTVTAPDEKSARLKAVAQLGLPQLVRLRVCPIATKETKSPKAA